MVGVAGGLFLFFLLIFVVPLFVAGYMY
jgi:hypothetical protein